MDPINQSFVDYIARNDFEAAQAADVAAKLAAIGITTVKHFVGYFSHGTEGPTVFKFWNSINEWKTKASYLARLREMMLTLQDNESEARERENLMLDNRVDNPIDRKTHDTLTKIWMSRYGIRLHPTQEGTHQIMGSMWRSLQTRQIIAEKVKSLRTIHSTQGIEPEKKTMMIGSLTALCPEQKRNDNGFSIGGNPFLWLLSLEVMLRTLCKAGSYLVTDPEDDRANAEIAAAPQVPNIDRSYIEEHLASCRSFILEWVTKNNGPSEAAILTQVSRIDHRIRTKWTDAYRANIPENVTFTRCIIRAESTSDGLWAADLTRDMQQGKGGPSMAEIRALLNAKGKGTGGGGGKNGTKNQDTKTTKTTKGGAKGAKKDKSKGSGLSMGPTVTVDNRKLKTVKSRGDKVYCSYYNSPKGCSRGKDCSFKHICSVLTAKGRVCEASHSATEHKGKAFSG